MMFEVQNGTVQTRKKKIFHSKDRTWNTRKYETAKPMTSVISQTITRIFEHGQIEGNREVRRKHFVVVVENESRDGLKIDVVEEADDNDRDQRDTEENQQDQRQRRDLKIGPTEDGIFMFGLLAPWIWASRRGGRRPPRPAARGRLGGDELIPLPGHVTGFVHDRVPAGDLAHAFPERAAVAHVRRPSPSRCRRDR